MVFRILRWVRLEALTVWSLWKECDAVWVGRDSRPSSFAVWRSPFSVIRGRITVTTFVLRVAVPAYIRGCTCLGFRTCPDRPWGPPSILYNGYRVFPGGKSAGTWHWTLTTSGAEVNENVELYIYCPSGTSWPVLGRNLPLPLLAWETRDRPLPPYLSSYIDILWDGMCFNRASRLLNHVVFRFKLCVERMLDVLMHSGRINQTGNIRIT